jgi:alkanesulfonate monooxygenase SsuD/methylene tetrahydromethanopterin reductase-like flavin-dependent oxidoreductase (luciferase family)
MAPPVDDINRLASPDELAGMEQMLRFSVVGSPDTVRQGLSRIIDQTGADELIMTAPIFDQSARLRSIELVAQVREELAMAAV